MGKLGLRNGKNMNLAQRLKKEIKEHKIDYFFLLLLLSVGVIIRLDGISSGDFPFLFDNGRDLLAVKNIVIDKKLTLLGPFAGLQGVFQSPLWYYLLAIPFILSSGDPRAIMLFMVFLGLVGIILAYFLGRKLFGRRFALVLALLLTLAPSAVFLSRIAWPPYPIPYLMIPFYFFLFRAVSGNSSSWVWAGIFGGIIAQIEVAYGLFLLPVLFLSFVLFRKKGQSFKYLIGAIFAFGLNFLPQLLFDFRHDFLMTRAVLGLFSGQSRGLGVVVPFPDRIFHRLNELRWATIGSLGRNNPISYLIFIIVTGKIFCLFFKKDKKKIRTVFLLLICPLVFFLAFLVYPYVAWSHYWIGLQTTYYFLAALVLVWLTREKSVLKFLPFLILLIWVAKTVTSPSLYVRKDEGGPTTYKNEIAAIDWIYQDAKGEPFGIFVYTPPVYDYAYQYLFWWRGTRKYGYLADKSKERLFYLIIEPDSERPFASKGWKETVIQTGKVIQKVVLPGQITIEKRHGEI